MTTLKIVDCDYIPEMRADETIRYMVTFKEHIYFATERGIYVILEEDEDYPADGLFASSDSAEK